MCTGRYLNRPDRGDQYRLKASELDWINPAVYKSSNISSFGDQSGLVKH
jgi:hypothetical protein